MVWLITSQSLRAAAGGLGVGIAGYLAMSRLLAGQLFGVSATDPLTLLAAAVGLLLICGAATAIPALRAVLSYRLAAAIARYSAFRMPPVVKYDANPKGAESFISPKRSPISRPSIFTSMIGFSSIHA